MSLLMRGLRWGKFSRTVCDRRWSGIQRRRLSGARRAASPASQGRQLRQDGPHQPFRFRGQPAALIAGEPKALGAKLLAEDSILLSQILDHLKLALVHPAGGSDQQELVIVLSVPMTVVETPWFLREAVSTLAVSERQEQVEVVGAAARRRLPEEIAKMKKARTSMKKKPSAGSRIVARLREAVERGKGKDGADRVTQVEVPTVDPR